MTTTGVSNSSVSVGSEGRLPYLNGKHGQHLKSGLEHDCDDGLRQHALGWAPMVTDCGLINWLTK